MMKVSVHYERRIIRSCWLFFLFLLMLGVTGCANLYSINIRYEPTKAFPGADAAMQKKIFTVTNFNEARKIDDPLKIGYVLRPNGRKIYILPEKVKASEAVANGVRDYIYKSGYSVSGVRAGWNLEEATIGSGWGDVVIGGVINKLEIVCDDSQVLSPVKTYTTVVNLGITLADGAAKKIVYRTSVEGSASLTDVTFSTEKLEKQLNGVLSDVIEKLLSGAEFKQQLKKAAEGS